MNLDPLIFVFLVVLVVHLGTAALREVKHGLAKGFLAVLCFFGIPSHEFGHFVPAMLFRMKVKELNLIAEAPNGRGYYGNVRTEGGPRNAIAGIAVTLGPVVMAMLVISFFSDLCYGLLVGGMDVLIIGVICIVPVGSAMACTPSWQDLQVLWHTLGTYKGQAFLSVVGMLIGCWVLVLLDAPVAPWWCLLVDVLVVFGTGTVCCKLYEKVRQANNH